MFFQFSQGSHGSVSRVPFLNCARIFQWRLRGLRNLLVKPGSRRYSID